MGGAAFCLSPVGTARLLRRMISRRRKAFVQREVALQPALQTVVEIHIFSVEESFHFLFLTCALVCEEGCPRLFLYQILTLEKPYEYLSTSPSRTFSPTDAPASSACRYW